jgi:hypothetical protein
MKTITKIVYATLGSLAVSCFAFPPAAQAVVPAPDGGYPGGNTAEGQNALFTLTSGGFNTAVGYLSLRSDTTGQLNTAVGAGALLANTGNNNTATGGGALLSNTTGAANTANGALALFSNISGHANTAIGVEALYHHTTGNSNTAIGNLAGYNLITGSNNVYIGQNTAGIAGESNACYIASIWGQTSVNSVPVLINSDNKLGTLTSSKRFKEKIRPMDNASEALFTLKPVTFHYEKAVDPAGVSQFGLVAEDVEKVNPDLVVRDKEGKPYSVRYDQVNAMLLNEFLKQHRGFLKEHRKVEKLEATVAQQQKGIEVLTAQLKTQAEQLQKVTMQIEMNKPVPKMVSSEP